MGSIPPGQRHRDDGDGDEHDAQPQPHEVGAVLDVNGRTGTRRINDLVAHHRVPAVIVPSEDESVTVRLHAGRAGNVYVGLGGGDLGYHVNIAVTLVGGPDAPDLARRGGHRDTVLGQLFARISDHQFGLHRWGDSGGGLRIGPFGVQHRLMLLDRSQDEVGVRFVARCLLDSRNQPRDNGESYHGQDQQADESVDHTGSARHHPFSFNALCPLPV